MMRNKRIWITNKATNQRHFLWITLDFLFACDFETISRYRAYFTNACTPIAWIWLWHNIIKAQCRLSTESHCDHITGKPCFFYFSKDYFKPCSRATRASFYIEFCYFFLHMRAHQFQFFLTLISSHTLSQ